MTKEQLIDESKRDGKRRVKFGDALFTAIERSDSLAIVDYLALAFEAFLNNEFGVSDLRLICHVIKNSFVDELIEVIETEHPQNLEHVVASGLADVTYQPLTYDMTSTQPHYSLSSAQQIRSAWRKYRQ